MTLTVLGLTGCSDPQEKREATLQGADALQKAGNTDAALRILEKLAEDYPNDPKILHQIGVIFKAQGDATMAAFFYEQAHQQQPEDVELLYETYQAVVAADQHGGQLLEKLAKLAPNLMSPDLWVELGDHYFKIDRSSSALDAYLKGVNPEVAEPDSATATTIGQLFVQMENPAQAEYWFNMAADTNSPDALTPLFGLLEVKLLREDWEGAEKIITRLDRQFPGAVDASKWSASKAQLVRWREAQTAMKDELAKAAAAREKTSESTESTVNAELSPFEGTTGGKAQVIADIEAAEALANTPAIEVVETDEESSPPAKNFDPDTVIGTAELDHTIGVTFDQQETSKPVEFTDDSTLADVSDDESGVDKLLPNDNVTSLRGTVEPRSAEELMNEATQATADKNYRLAISNYWQILGSANDRDDIWNLLSRTYVLDGQHKNAETTALEAIRLQPRNISYTLDYLRAAQRSKKPAEFFAEIQTAYDRFPQNPEVTLSLARGYERIAKNNAAARILYQRFIDLASDHPLRAEAETAITRLQ